MTTDAVPASQPDAVTDSQSDASSSQEHVPPAGTESPSKPAPETEADRNWRQMREDRDYYRSEISRLQQMVEARSQRQGREPEQQQAPEKGLQTLADFEFDDSKYQTYLLQHTAESAREAVRAELAAERERTDKATRVAAFEDRQKAFAKDNPDYTSAVSNPRFTQSDALLAELMSSEEGPALAQYLANNLDVTARLNRMSPVDVAREVVRLELKVVTEREKAKAARNQLPVGSQPAPTPKLEGSGDPLSGISPDSAESDVLDPDVWLRKRNRQVKKLNQR